jgi:hypothetical protein
MTSAKLFVQEWIRFSVFPQGVFGEFSRATPPASGSAGPDLGWAYGGGVLGQAMVIADAFARNGDLSLYTYQTSLGACGTAGTINDGGTRVGQDKDLLFAMQSYAKYNSDTYARYYQNTGDTDYRIDGRDTRSGSNWSGVHDTYLAEANVYFKDTFVKGVYMRTQPGTVAYPSNPISGPPAWTGENGIFPGILFMYGNMEGKVWPYPGEEQELPAPTNLRVQP